MTNVERRRVALAFVVFLTAMSLLAAPSPALADNGFEKEHYVVAEAADYVDLNVDVDFCCPTAQGQIDYQTFDATAVAGRDYWETSGTLTFAGGGRNRIRVPITEDELVEADEQFEVRLSNFRGSFVNRGYETAVVRILDDDPKKASEGSPSAVSNQPRPGSESKSSANPPSPSLTVLASPGATDTGSQSSPLDPNGRAPGESRVLEGEEPAAGESSGNDALPSSLAGWALLVVTVAAVGLGVKMSLRRRSS